MLGVDVGGTFTDVVCVRDGAITVTKVASDASDPAAPVVEGARRLGTAGTRCSTTPARWGSTRSSRGRLPKVAFLTTEGHRDMLDRGRMWRPPAAQTDMSWRRSFSDASRPLVPRYLRRGVVERLLADGDVLIPLDEAQARTQLEVLRRCNVEGVAICLINAYVNDAHERRLRELVHEVLGRRAGLDLRETSPLAKEYARASTTVIDVFMKLKFTRYAHELDARAARARVRRRSSTSPTARRRSFPADRRSRGRIGWSSRGPAAGTMSQRPLRRRDRRATTSSAPTSAAPRLRHLAW